MFSVRCLPAPSSAVRVFSRSMAGMAGRDVRMRVLLQEDGPLGLKHDVISVKRGYGRNVLVRQGKAVYATAENLHYANVAKLRAASLKAAEQQQQQPEEATEANTTPDAQAATPTTGVDNLRYQLDLLHRFSNQQSPIFYRPIGRDGNFSTAFTTKDLYVKLSRRFPSLTLSQLTLAAGQPVTKVGEYTAEVALPGIAKPATFKVIVKKLEQRQPRAVPLAA